MCDNKNELHKSEKDKSKRNTSTRLDLDITDTTDTYPEFDFLDLLRNLQVENKKSKNKLSNEESANKSNSCSDESDVELLARFYDEKYGKDYEFDADGYDEDDSFIDNSDAVIELIPNGIQTEFGGFYINRGKLNLIREENSSSSVSEDVDKFLSQKKLVTKRSGADEEGDEKPKENCKNAGSNSISSNNISSKSNNSVSNVQNNATPNNVNNSVNNVNNNSGNNCNVGNSNIKSRKRSGEFYHKSKKNRKTATPKIPDHLIQRKPFSGSSEFRKNINEIKKNRMKNLEAERKTVSSDLVSSDSPSVCTTGSSTETSITTSTTTSSNYKSSNSYNNNNNSNNNNHINSCAKGNYDNEVNNTNNCGNNNSNSVNNNSNNNNNNDHHHNHYINSKKEMCVKKKAALVKEIIKDRDAASAIIEAVATGADLSKTNDGESSSDSDTSETSNSDSGSESSDEKYVEKRKTVPRSSGEVFDSQRLISPNGVVREDFTAKNFAHLNDNLKGLLCKIIEISKEEKTKLSNSKLNGLLLRIDSRLRELPVSERSAVLDHLATILQLKKESITKKTKKLLFVQEENKMSVPLKRLKELVADMMPAIESNYLKEFTKITGTSGVEPGPLPQKKFVWNDDVRCYLRDIIKHRENCYHIIRPRKESLSDYVRNFLESKLLPLWPKDWMTVDILWEEGKSNNTGTSEEKSKSLTKSYISPNSSNTVQKKPITNLQSMPGGNKKNLSSMIQIENSKSSTIASKSPEVKSILIPRKVPQNILNSTKSNYPNTSCNSLQPSSSVNRCVVSSGQDFYDKMQSHSSAPSRNLTQQVANNKLQQQTSPNRVIKPVSCITVQNQTRANNNVRTTSPSTANKSVPYRNCNSSQSNVYKTIELHSKPVAGSKSVGNSVTISPVTESMFKDISSTPEILNLTKNPSVCISKITDCSENKSNRSNSPSINRPLPSGITISPTNSLCSNFGPKQKKPSDRNSENRINVSITKQESNGNLTKEKRKSVLNMNLKREGPLQNIPDCISVTSNMVSPERFNKVEHPVRKRAIQEYHEQQQQRHSPERLKLEEKKIKLEENFLSDLEVIEEKIEEKNSKLFDSMTAKTSESIKHENIDCQSFSDRYSGLDEDSFMNSNSLSYCSPGLSHYVGKAPKLRDVRVGKEKSYVLVKSENTMRISDDKRSDECDDHSENVKELQVQKEMDRVMQNLVELSSQRLKDSEYEIESHYSSSTPPLRTQSSFPVYQKMLYK